MATNDYEQEAPPSGPVVFIARTRDLANAAAGTDDALSFRTLLLLILVGIAAGSAPMPLALVGVAAAVWLALDVARLSWRKR